MIQREMSVLEYEAKFVELSRYAGGLVATEEEKARKFEKGLRPEIREKIFMLRLPSLAEVVDRAFWVEKETLEI